jgi:hypothetical protein
LEVHNSWHDKEDSLESTKTLWYQIRSYITHKSEHKKIVSWLKNETLMGRWLPESGNRSEMFMGEYYWSPSADSFRNHYYRGEFWEDIRGQKAGKSIGKVSVTALQYLWENSHDQSKSYMIPNEFLFNLLNLKPTKGGCEFKDERGNLIAYDPSAKEAKVSSLIVNKNALVQRLNSEGYEIFWTVLGEKQVTNRASHSKGTYSLPTEISMILYFENGAWKKSEIIDVKSKERQSNSK